MTQLTIAEASARSGISPSHLRSLCREGAVKARRWGKSWMVNVASLDAWTAQEHKRGPKPQGRTSHLTPSQRAGFPLKVDRSRSAVEEAETG